MPLVALPALVMLFAACAIAGPRTTSDKCPLGSIPKAGGCRECPIGTFYSKVGRSERCMPCPQGTFNAIPGILGIELCLPCPSGTFSNLTRLPSADACTKCPPGQSSISGAVSCVRCPAGTYIAAANDRIQWNRRISVCLPCPDFTFSAAANAAQCSTCRPPLVGNDKRTGCGKCKPGFGPPRLDFRSSNACSECSLYTISDGKRLCSRCPPGSINPEFSGGTSCTPCPPGTASSQDGDKCEPCPPGTVSGRGAPLCVPRDTPCPQDYFMDRRNVCRTCSTTERFDKRRKACVPCGRGRVSRGGMDEQCRSCPFGKIFYSRRCVCKLHLLSSDASGLVYEDDRGFIDLQNFTCTACPAGQLPFGRICSRCFNPFEYVPRGSRRCVPCPPGGFQNEKGTGCRFCPPGTRVVDHYGFFYYEPSKVNEPVCVSIKTGCPHNHRRIIGRSGDLVNCEALSCPAGTRTKFFQGDEDPKPVRTCLKCTGGFFTEPGKQCKRCAKNTVSTNGLVRRCKPCPDGVRTDVGRIRCGCEGKPSRLVNGKCELCPRGTYGTFEAGFGCRRCPSGSVNTRRGSDMCWRCDAGSVPSKDQSKCVKCPPGTISFGIGDSQCVKIGALARRKEAV